MRGSLYCATVSTFIKALDHDSISDQIVSNFRAVNGYSPAESEVVSWQRSWPELGRILEKAAIPEAGILFEYRLPLSSARVDCVITGSDSTGGNHTLLIELKQWATGNPSDIPNCVSVYGQDVLHPSAQVLAYGDYLSNCHSAFVSGETDLLGCAYLHNVNNCAETVFCSTPYSHLLEKAPVFSRITESDFSLLLQENMASGAGLEMARVVDFGAYAPSRDLLGNAA